MTASARAEIITRRTYARPTNEEETQFETWPDIVTRVIGHQRWLWERAKGAQLNQMEELELAELEQLMLDRVVTTSGRTLWLGGTKIAQTREASQFNCSFTHAKTVNDIVDIIWLLMQGCGVGFEPMSGSLFGFPKRIENIEVIRSTRTLEDWKAGKRGRSTNREMFNNGVWTISIGDSAEAWSKGIGKLVAGKYAANKLVIDLSEIRPAGVRLKGYGWISSGDEQLAIAMVKIAEILNSRVDQVLTRLNILDIVNWLGTILSSRRSAEIALVPYGDPEWREFAKAKDQWWVNNPQRAQSNNSLLFWNTPTKPELTEIFDMMQAAGGSEPGFINGAEARRRAPWFYGSNPCCEILLGDKSFCNLVEVDIAKFDRQSHDALLRALQVAARANYRQTCVNLNDGILQDQWHHNNNMLRLCGVGLTGIAQRDDLTAFEIAEMRITTKRAAYRMADELGQPRPKNVTTVKPSGTLSKIMDTTEGVHKPLGKYIFNHVVFGRHDPVLDKLRAANYYIFDHPVQTESVIVRFPVAWEQVKFDDWNGMEVNLESAVTQLDRYHRWQVHWCDQNVSNTISYSPEEAPAIVDWLLRNWNDYVGVSFLYRADPTKTAADLGYLYLPQEVVTAEVYHAYASTLKPVQLNDVQSNAEVDAGDECAGGACPIK